MKLFIYGPKVLFLADRNVLADQAFNTFNPLEKDIVRVNGKEIRKRGGKVPTNAMSFLLSISLSLSVSQMSLMKRMM